MKNKIAILFLLILTACSTKSEKEFDLIGKDFRFTPDTLSVENGDTVRINFSNPDTVPHLINLPDFNFHVGLPAGGEYTLEFTADKVGSFEFVCNVPGHQEAGMVGTLIVNP